MSVQHFKSLLFRSTQIQQEIDEEHQRRRPDWLRLLKLKKIRLAIKDRMQRLVHIHKSKRPQAKLKGQASYNDHWLNA